MFSIRRPVYFEYIINRADFARTSLLHLNLRIRYDIQQTWKSWIMYEI